MRLRRPRTLFPSDAVGLGPDEQINRSCHTEYGRASRFPYPRILIPTSQTFRGCCETHPNGWFTGLTSIPAAGKGCVPYRSFSGPMQIGWSLNNSSDQRGPGIIVSFCFA
jgi:hypothetical protein